MHPVDALPTGTVTFLFTDIEGSTRLAERLGTATWSELLEAHQAILRQAFAASDGREIKTEGDSFFVVFRTAPAAVGATGPPAGGGAPPRTRARGAGGRPAGVGLRDLGGPRRKDLPRPERIGQLVIVGLPDHFPALKTLSNLPNNLPVMLTTFVGRGSEVARVRELLAESRLLTLTGPGGTGKTRLSLQLAAGGRDSFPDGVFFLAP